MVNLFGCFGRFAILSLFFTIVSLQPLQASEKNQWYEYLLNIPGLSYVRITTNIKLNGEQSKPLDSLPAPAEKIDMSKNQYVFIAGRGDHAGKFMNFFNAFLAKEKDAYIWCIDPYGQGGSGGSVSCEYCDPHSSEPCCLRRGDGIWDNYAKAYVHSIDGIYKCLDQDSSQRPHLVAIPHSMSGNVDLYARLNPIYKDTLTKEINTLHYVAPMVNFSLELGYRGWREEAVRDMLYWLTWGYSKAGWAQNYMSIGSGPIDAFKLQPADVYDKVAKDKAEAFIKVCQQNYKLEIGKSTNEWFYQAVDACTSILGITREDFGTTKVFVHGPGDDQVVYPNWLQDYFIGKNLVDKNNFHAYAGEPHNLFWGTDEGIANLISNLVSLS